MMRPQNHPTLLPAKAWLCGLLAGLAAPVLALDPDTPATGSFNVNANANWSTAATWNGAVPNGVDHVADFLNNITTTRTITIDAGVGSNVILGGLRIGDTSGGSVHQIAGGTLTFQVTEGNAFYTRLNKGGSNTISSAIQLNSALDVLIAETNSNGQGATFSGKISGGVTGVPTINLRVNDSDNFVRHLLLNNATNDFAGQIVVHSGLLRLEGSDGTGQAAGLRGVGNEVIVLDGGRVDLRNTDYNQQAEDTEIFIIEGKGVNGLGAIANTSSTATLSHLELSNDATLGGGSTLELRRHLNAAGDADIAAVLDLRGNEISILGPGTKVLENVDIRNATGAAWHINEGGLQFRNRGGLLGGGLIGGSLRGNEIDGMTFNVMYYKGAYDGVDPTNGSRSSSDLYNPNRNGEDFLGGTEAAARLIFRTDWSTGNTHVPNTKVTEMYDNVTINLSYGSLVREGSTGTGQTFDQIFGTGTTVNLVGGGMNENIINMTGGASGYNAALDAYDHPGVMEIQGAIDNTTGDNEGTGFTKRGNRELRLTGSNPGFDGDVLVKQNTGRFMPMQFSTSSATAAAESQFFSMSLAGADGGLTGANSITLTRWGSLALLNNSANAVYGSANNNDRLNDAGSLILRNGYVVLETDPLVANTENFGNVVADHGTNYLYLDTRAGGQFDGSFASLSFANGGVLKIYDMNGEHTWGTGAADDRLRLNDATGLTMIGADSPGSNTQGVIPGLFGGTVPTTFTASTGTQRTDYTTQNAYAYNGVGLGLMTLDGGYLRPLTASEYAVGGTPVAGANWLVDRYIDPGNTAGLDNYANRNVTEDTTVNSLTISFDALSSGQNVPGAAKDYVIIEPGKTLTVNSGIINFASFMENNGGSLESVIRGGRISMNGQTAILNAASNRHDLDTTSGSLTTFFPGNSTFLRSSLVDVGDLVKTGRHNLYLDTWSEISGNVYVSEQGGLFARHPGALGEGAPGREVQVGGAGNFYLEYGTNISGINIRATNTFDTSRTILAALGTSHSTWGGDVIMDTADAAGSGEFQGHVITARNNGTLTLYGNVYSDNNANFTGNDTWNDPVFITTAVGETATINFRGQFRDTETGPLARVTATGDGANQLDRNHSLSLQMRGHDEINVNMFKQWNATGAIYAAQGYFRIMYDPAGEGMDGAGFHTDAARGAIAQDNQWNQMWLGGPQNTLGIANSATNAYNGHIMLTQENQVLNFRDRVMISNNNRNRTLTLGGEHTSGTAYIGSMDPTTPYILFYQNTNSERDLRFLQVRGGTLEVNARLLDGNSTADSFNSTVSVVGPGTVHFNANTASSTVDRWNFMAGTTVWGGAYGNSQFARTRTTGSNVRASVSTWGGGDLILATPDGTTRRTQTLDGNIYMLNGSSTVTVNDLTTMTIGDGARARVLDRRSGSTLTFMEEGNGIINFGAAGVSMTAGDFLGSWGVYGNAAGGVDNWAAREGTTGVQAFAGYDNDVFGATSHTNMTANAVLPASAEIQTLRIGVEAVLDIGADNTLALSQGGLLIPASNVGNVSITGGTLTSTWSDGGNDLLIHNYGQGVTTIGSVIANEGVNKVNLVHGGSGTTVLTADNTLTGNVYLNDGVLQISSDSQLGQVNGTITRIVLVAPGTSYASGGTTGAAVSFEGGGGGTGAAGTFNTINSSTSSLRGVNNITVTDGGSGYISGVEIGLSDGIGSNAGAWAILDSGNLHFDGGVLHATESLALNSGRTIFLGGNGGVLRVAPGKTLTIDGFISGEYNHVHGANGYGSSNSLGAAWDASSVSNPDIGDLTIDGGGMVLFRYSPLGDGSSPVNLAHAYGGITWINEGILRLEGVASTGAAGALGTHRSFVDSTVIGDNGTLDMAFSASTTLLEWLTFDGRGYQGGGTISLVKAGTAVSNSLAGQIHVKEDALLKMMNGGNIYINNGGGDMFGTGDIIRMGGGEFRFYGNNPEWTGSFLSASGTSRVIGTGSLGGLSSMELERNSIFYVSTATTSVDEFRDRLPDGLAISGDGYTRLRMDATGGIHSGMEKVGTLTVKGGVMGIEYNLGADLIGNQPRLQGDYAGFHFAEIDRQPGATVHLRNLDSGTDFAGSEFSSGVVTDRAVLMVDNAPLTIGGGDGLNGNQPVVPGFFGGTRSLFVASSNGTTQRFDEAYSAFRLVTVDSDGAGGNYLRPLRDSEYKTVANPGGDSEVTTSASLDAEGLTADQNLRIVGRDSDSISSGQLGAGRKNSLLTLGLSSTVNSLTFNSETYVVNSAANPSSSSTMGGDHTTLHLRDDTRLTVASGMIQTANFGVLDRQGLTNSGNANLDIRSQINAGTLDFDGQEAQVYVGGFFARYNTSTQENGYEGIDADNTTLTIASNISNASALVKSGPGTLILTGVNDFTGDTYINQGNLYVRSDFALNGTQNVHVNGLGGFLVSQGAKISGVNIHVGVIGGNNLALALEQSATWGGDIILNNVDVAGATAYTRNFVPRIYTNSTNQGAIEGNIYGGSQPLASGVNATESRIFTTYTGAAGILDLRGQVRDTVSGALGTLVTEANQNQVLRMEVSATTNEANVQLWQPYDASGQINLKRGYLRYMGDGNFYTDAAAASVNPDNLMSGFHMGGRVLIAGEGLTVSNLAFMLANEGATFNLSSWTVGGDVSDPDNISGSGNWGLGNTTGNSTLGGENRSGEVVFGTGTGAIKFTPYTTVVDRDLRLYAAPGGEVTIRASFVDGGTEANPVNTSITKIGAGQVNLQGSTAGASTVEGVNVMGGLLLLVDYDANPERRVGLNASLLMGGGILAMEGGLENFGTLSVAAGGSAVAVIGAGRMEIATLGSVADGGSLHFQSIAGGTLQIGGLAEGDRLGSFATFGSALSADPTATDWAAVGVGGQIVAFTGYSDDTLGAGLHTNALSSALVGGETESVRFNTDGAAFASGTLTLNDGGLLFTSAYTGGTAFAAGTGLTTAGGSDLILHNYSSGAVTIAGDITGNQNVIFTGIGETVLTGGNTYAGTTFVTGAATVTADGMSRLGTGSLHLNGGTVHLTGSDTEIYGSGITLGSSDGTLQVDAGKTLVLRGVVTSEANPVASRTTNPNSGGLRIEGTGTVQFGERTDGSTLVGVANNYTGLTLLGDGTNPLHITMAGGGGNNAQHAPFGTTESWTDGTIVRNNVTLEYAPQYSAGAGTGQVRYREWMQFGEQAGDQIYIRDTTQRQIMMDGFYNVVGDLNIHSQSASLNNGGTGNSSFTFNANEGSLAGTGDIIKTGTGNLYFYNTMVNWTGDLDLREGLTLQLMYPGASLENTGMIYLGDPAGDVTSTVSYRVQTRYGNATTGVDSGRQRLDIPRDITIRDGISQEVQIGGGSSPDITMVYSGDINLGNGSTGGGGAVSPNHVRFIYTDSVAYDGILTGHQQHAVMIVSGNLSGSNNLMLENYEDGSANNDVNDQFTTFHFSGDNSAYTGKLTIGSEVGAGSGNFDRDDNEIFRAGSDNALTVNTPVEMRNLTTFQAGGHSLTIGGLVANDGISTTGLYSFTSPTFDPARQTTADLDGANLDINATSGTLHGSASGSVNYIPVGNSSAIIENASVTPGTLGIYQENAANWDVYFRDGVPSAQFEDSTATPGSLSLEKLGPGLATLSIFNDYTGSTTVREGALEVGKGGTGEWNFVTQGSVSVISALKTNANTVAGSTGTGLTTVMAGATISGSGHIRGGLDVYGTLSPGDAVVEAAGGLRGTLFIGDGATGDITIRDGALLSMQVALPTMVDPDLQNGTYSIDDPGYNDHVQFLSFFSSSPDTAKAFPNVFGEPGTNIPLSAHDHLEVSGNLTWNGGQISVLGDANTSGESDGFNPAAGQVYNLMDWFGISDWGDFSAGSGRYLVGNGDDNGDLDLPDLSAYPDLRWDTGIFTTHGALVISLVPEPSRALLTLAGLGLLFFRRRR